MDLAMDMIFSGVVAVTGSIMAFARIDRRHSLTRSNIIPISDVTVYRYVPEGVDSDMIRLTVPLILGRFVLYNLFLFSPFSLHRSACYVVKHKCRRTSSL